VVETGIKKNLPNKKLLPLFVPAFALLFVIPAGDLRLFVLVYLVVIPEGNLLLRLLFGLAWG